MHSQNPERSSEAAQNDSEDSERRQPKHKQLRKNKLKKRKPSRKGKRQLEPLNIVKCLKKLQKRITSD